jgi:transposase-like protein
VRLSKPRVRSVAGEELSLPTWEAYRDEDPLGERAVEQILCGVSTRKYDRSLEPLGGEHESVGTSKSSVSRRFVARTRRQVEVFLSRPLEDLDLPVLMFDGVEMGRHLLIVALGIAWDGHKHVLGLVEGSTESSEVCRHLLRQLIARGLRVERRRLIVMDGSKGLAKAIRKTFGRWCVVQRCRVHKMRNVTDHLPKHLRPWFQAKIRKAWKIASAEEAKSKLFALARELETEHPGAAASLREGLDETLTVNWLGMSGALLQT